MVQELPGEVAHPGGAGRPALLGAPHDTRLGPEAQLPRGAASGGRTQRAFLDQPAREQVPEPLRDDGAAQTRPARQLGSGAGRPRPHEIEHCDQTVELVLGDIDVPRHSSECRALTSVFRKH